MFIQTIGFAQRNFHLNREWGLDFEKTNATIPQKLGDSLQIAAQKHPTLPSAAYTNFKPFIGKTIRQTADKSKPLIARKFKNESLFIVADSADKFYLTLDPLFNFEGGMDTQDASEEVLMKNTRGFLLVGDIGDKFSFQSSFYENQATYAQYIDDYIVASEKLFTDTKVVPGQGRTKQFRTNGYDYSMASGYISYSPSQHVNVQLGHGKHFVGDGYRSLLLSDNSYNYPYARITTNFGNVQYTNLYTTFMNLTTGGVTTPKYIEELFQKKVGSFQMLNANLFSRLSLGLFQGMIWQAADSTNRQHLNLNTFNPIIGVNSGVYGLGNNNNMILGATFKLKITNSIALFGQYVLDDLAAKMDANGVMNKFGFQVGFKYFDLFTINNLHFQGEFNRVNPYTYASKNPNQSYTHFNQPLAHPLGANFNEWVGIINYRYKRFFVELKVNYAVQGVDSSGFNFGADPFMSDASFNAAQDLSSIKVGQGLQTTTMYQDIHLGMLINPVTNFNFVLGVSNRIFIVNDLTNNTRIVYMGIRTSLSNFYFDF